MGIFVGTGASSAHRIDAVGSASKVRQVVAEMFEPRIGQIKYLARPDKPAVDTNSGAFDGWVYADGHAMTASDFQGRPGAFERARAVFGAPGADRFTVPNMQYFVKPSPGPCTDGAVRPASVSLAGHSHGVHASMEYKVDGIVKDAFRIGIAGTNMAIKSYICKPDFTLTANFPDATVVTDGKNTSSNPYKQYVNATNY